MIVIKKKYFGWKNIFYINVSSETLSLYNIIRFTSLNNFKEDENKKFE